MYRNGNLEDEDFPLAAVSEHLEVDGAVVWVDLCAPDPAELQLVADELSLHALAVEDALNERQRPKLDRYATHSFLSAYSAQLDPGSGRLVTGEVAAFILPNALVTVRKDDHFDIDGVTARWDDAPDLAKLGVGALLYGMLDFVVDGHFAAVQSLDEQIEDIEDLLFERSALNEDVQRRSFTLRKSLVLLRRVVLPMREVVNTLMRRELHVVADELMPYYQDVYDHILRASEWTESLRDLVTSILETNLTIQGNRLNIITKQVTSWAAIVAVPTAITGFYGQNVPYPGFGTHSGLIASSVLIVVLSALLYVVFKRKDWL
jgi:magnesium transporter